MGVSIAIYRARIGLFHPRASGSSNRISNISNHATSRLLAGALVSTTLDIVVMCCVLVLVNTLLTVCGDVELNPGPAGREHSEHNQNFTFCHANMRSIKRCPEKLDHIKPEFIGTYDVITISETWLSPEDNLDKYGNPLYTLGGYHVLA